MAKEKFAAFFSYVHQDDTHDGGRLTKIREWFEGEISAQTGEPFEIFQDRDDISWGDAWEDRINGALDGSTFLIAVITPRFLKSAYCRKEFQRFAKREKELDRNDLILPLLYMDTQGLDDPDDKVAVAISSRQYADWRHLRFEPWTNPEVPKRLSELSKMVCDAMPRKVSQTKLKAKKPKVTKPKATLTESHGADQIFESISPKPATSIEPLTLIVDPMPRRGDFTTITEAIQSAEPGTRILIRSGLYKEALVLDKALELIGDGERDDIVIEISNNNTLSFKTEFGRVSNLTLRQAGGGKYSAVNILQGRLELEDCDITSRSLACVTIHDDADPRLRRNRIHDGKESGIFIYANGKGTLEDNDIWGNAYSGITIKTGANPTLRRNRIHDGKKSGVFIYDNGKGILEDNDIYTNAYSGVSVKEGGNPTLLRNRINKNLQSGIYIYKNGNGIFRDNDLRNNKKAWNIDDSSKDNVTRSGNIEE